MASKSFIQTVEVYMSNSTNKFLTMKMAPPRLDDSYYTFYDDNCTRKQTLPDKTTYWKSSGEIRVVYEDGLLEVYHPKPYMNEIIGNPSAVGEYYRIHPGGAVEHGFGGEYYYWGKEEDIEWDMSNIEVCDENECSCERCEQIRFQNNYPLDELPPDYWTNYCVERNYEDDEHDSYCSCEDGESPYEERRDPYRCW